MAYENGRRIHSHYNSLYGKRKQKNTPDIRFSWLFDEEEYWKEYSLSKLRKAAKKQTSKKVRHSKNTIGNYSKYKRCFDYSWLVY